MTGKPRILIVEDDPANRMLFRDLLEFAGFTVEIASTTEDGRRMLGESRPSLVILDIRLPGGGGELLLSEMKRDPTLASIPAIAVTAYAMAGDEDRFLAMGFDDYISKPIDVRSFAARVASSLPGSSEGE